MPATKVAMVSPLPTPVSAAAATMAGRTIGVAIVSDARAAPTTIGQRFIGRSQR